MFYKITSITKWNPDQPRDERGRFASGSSGGGGNKKTRGGAEGGTNARAIAATDQKQQESGGDNRNIANDTRNWANKYVVSTEQAAGLVKGRGGRYSDAHKANADEIAHIRGVVASMPREILAVAAENNPGHVIPVVSQGQAFRRGNLVVVRTQANSAVDAPDITIRHEFTHALLDDAVIKRNGGDPDKMWAQVKDRGVPPFLHAQRAYERANAKARLGVSETITMLADTYRSGDTIDAQARTLVSFAEIGRCRVAGEPRGRQKRGVGEGRPMTLTEAKSAVKLWREWTGIEAKRGRRKEEVDTVNVTKDDSVPDVTWDGDGEFYRDWFQGLCLICRHYWGATEGADRCDAFPDGIPEDIIDSVTDHRMPLPNDNGIQWECVHDDWMKPPGYWEQWPHEIDAPLCQTCRHLHSGEIGLRCDAFTDWIPDAILSGRADHSFPYPGDNGVRYEKSTQQ
jgi:hypothetical protein